MNRNGEIAIVDYPKEKGRERERERYPSFRRQTEEKEGGTSQAGSFWPSGIHTNPILNEVSGVGQFGDVGEGVTWKRRSMNVPALTNYHRSKDTTSGRDFD